MIGQSFRYQSFWQELNPRQVNVQADTPNSLTDQVLIATCLYIRIDTKQFLFVYRYVASPGGRLSTKHTPCSSLKSDFKSPTDYRAFLTCQYSLFSALLVFFVFCMVYPQFFSFIVVVVFEFGCIVDRVRYCSGVGPSGFFGVGAPYINMEEQP